MWKEFLDPRESARNRSSHRSADRRGVRHKTRRRLDAHRYTRLLACNVGKLFARLVPPDTVSVILASPSIDVQKLREIGELIGRYGEQNKKCSERDLHQSMHAHVRTSALAEKLPSLPCDLACQRVHRLPRRRLGGGICMLRLRIRTRGSIADARVGGIDLRRIYLRGLPGLGTQAKYHDAGDANGKPAIWRRLHRLQAKLDKRRGRSTASGRRVSAGESVAGGIINRQESRMSR